MRTALILALVTIVTAHAATAGTPRPSSWKKTRALTSSATTMLADATERSSIVKSLLADLERTDVVVYVSDSMSGTAREVPAYLEFVSYAAGIRYLLVRIDRWKLTPSDRIMWLGHELQHALEIATAPDVKDTVGLAQLYRRIGREDRRGRFESDGARATGERVRIQLAGRDR